MRKNEQNMDDLRSIPNNNIYNIYRIFHIKKT